MKRASQVEQIANGDSQSRIDASVVVDRLSQPTIYPDRPQQVSVVETHISWVFLTDHYAYKLKKPLKYDFLDFSTLEKRHHFCLKEVALNRRLAPQAYLDVVPVTESPTGRLGINGDGPVVEWLVRMRRLPADRSLDQLITTGSLRETEIQQIEKRLTEFYRNLAPLPLHTELYRQRIEAHVKGNFNELLDPFHKLDPSVVKRVHSSQFRVLRLFPETFDNRVRDGRIVEGHGDLRPEHIYLNPTPSVIDCVEFNAEFRQVDVLDELSFLAIECAALGGKVVGDRILNDYLKSSGDRPPPELVPFYQCYRASVRAKVHALRARQVLGGDRRAATLRARDYLALAEGYAAQLGPPFLLVVRGLSGSGKSTIATALAKSLETELIQTDSVRRKLFGSSKQATAYNAFLYRDDKRRMVYDEVLEAAASLLEQRASVIIDGTFLAAETRTKADSVARRHKAVPVFIECCCPTDVACQRIARRCAEGNSVSEAQPDFVVRQQAELELDPPGIVSCQLDTTDSIPEILQQIYQHLRKSVAEGG